MTDVGNVQAGAVGTAQVTVRPKVQVVPLKGLPIVAAVSAPSTLAAEFADANGQTLIGFLRPQRMNIYSHPQRVKFAQA